MTNRYFQKSFTLIEVIAALMIIAIAFTAIVQAQGGSVRTVLRSENLSQALGLAQDLMTELELQMRRQNLASFPQDESGEFQEEKLQAFRWTRKLEPVNLACFIPTGDSSQTGTFQAAEQIFERGVRKASVIVEWDEGRETRSAELTQLLIRFEELPQL